VAAVATPHNTLFDADRAAAVARQWKIINDGDDEDRPKYNIVRDEKLAQSVYELHKAHVLQYVRPRTPRLDNGQQRDSLLSFFSAKNKRAVLFLLPTL
jgi:hypothetical protein